MIAYVDSSVVLRLILGQAGRLPEWRTVDQGVASALVEVECLRMLDRMRLAEPLAEDEIAVRREAVYRVVEPPTRALGKLHPSLSTNRRSSSI